MNLMTRMLACVLVTALSSSAWQAWSMGGSDTTRSITVFPEGRQYRGADGNDPTTVVHQAGSGRIRVIIEMVGDPLGKLKSRSLRKQSITEMRRSAAELREQIRALGPGGELPVEFGREFVTAFYGMTADIPESALRQLASMPSVKAVHRVVPVKALLDESTTLVRAPELRTASGADGSGVKVAVLDSGIDYLHPALGGAFGPGQKVAGGYDFVNNDADPMDDHMHGTHVAGIIASSDAPYTGVAPGATLYGVKVLDQDGNGTSDEILAGIEWCLDPNGDGDFSDKMDIVNMSLGGPGDPDDPMSVAVDVCSVNGVLFAIAAGNDGRYYQIGSPGTSREALTVGAVDKGLAMAPFSSKGPTRKAFTLKPEVVAPGVAITSTVTGGSFMALSGTSMATPHVAGLSALLKQLHPEWTPQEIKSALVTQAKDLGEEAVAQGSGLVDAVRSHAVQSFAVPASASFGIVGASGPSWQKTVQVLLKNDRTGTQYFTYEPATAPAGMSLLSSPSGVSIPAGGTVLLDFTLTVDKSVVQDKEGAYSGLIRLAGSLGDTLVVPWSASKLSILTMNFDRPYVQFILSNSTTAMSGLSEAAWSSDGMQASLYCKTGDYGIAADLTESSGSRRIMRLWFQDGLHVENETVVNVELDALPYRIVLNSKNEEGIAFRDMESSRLGDNFYTISVMFPTDYAFARSTFIETSVDTIHATALPAGFQIAVAGLHSSDEYSKWYSINYPAISRLQADVELTTTPADLVHAVLKHSAHSSWTSGALTSSRTDEFRHPRYGMSSFAWFREPEHPTDVAQGVRLYLNASSGDPHLQSIGLSTRMGNGTDSVTVDTPPVRTASALVGAYGSSALTPHTQLVASGDTVWFSPSPHFAEGSLVGLRPLLVQSSFRTAEYSRLGSRDSSYVVFHLNGGLVHSGYIRSLVNFGTYQSGQADLAVYGPPSLVGRIKAVSSVSYRFRFDQLTAIPAVRTLETLTHAGVRTSQVAKGDSVRLQFTTTDAALPLVEAKRNNEESWVPLAVVPGGLAPGIRRDYSGTRDESLWSADLTQFTMLDSSLIDLRVTLSSGTTEAVYRFVPALAVGEGTLVTDMDDAGAHVVSVESFALEQNYPNPFNGLTNIAFMLPVTSEVRIEILNLLGQRLNVIELGARTAGRHVVSVDVGRYASGVYFYRMLAGGRQLTRKMVLAR